MAEGVTIEISNLNEVKKRFGMVPKGVIRKAESVMASVANEFVNRAVQDAPVDQGILKNQISFSKTGVMEFKIVSGASWSAFIEFGTRNRTQVPAEYAQYAAQFQGKGGGGGRGFFDQILDWVKRKGITGTYSVETHRRQGSKVDKQVEDEQVAYAIYKSILFHGIHAHPFFLKQLPQAKLDLNKGLEGVVHKALEK